MLPGPKRNLLLLGLSLLMGCGMAVFLLRWSGGRQPLRCQRPPTICSHRGRWSAIEEANTMVAVHRAVEREDPCVEVDITMTRDGVLVMAHPTDFRKRGLGELHQLNHQDVQPPLATIEDVLSGTGTAGSSSRFQLIFDVKAVGDASADSRLAPALYKAAGSCAYCLVMCKETKIVQEMETQEAALRMPTLSVLRATRIIYPTEVDHLEFFYAAASTTPPPPAVPGVQRYIAVEQTLLNHTLLAGLRASNFNVLAWTVDTGPQTRQAFDVGVDTIISNRPDGARQVLDAMVHTSGCYQ